MSKKITFVFIGIIILFVGIIIGLTFLLVSQEVQGLTIGRSGDRLTIKSQVNMDTEKITNLGPPAELNDAATVQSINASLDGMLSNSVGIGTTNPQAKLHVKIEGGGSCIGVAAACYNMSIDMCGPTELDPQFGCSWIGDCGDLGLNECKTQTGCTWDWENGRCTGTYCEGFATPCSSLNEDTCRLQIGCSWQPSGVAAIFEGGFVGLEVANPTYRLELPNEANESGRGRANQWVTYSSIRWKENIVPIIDALKKLVQVQGVYFNWKPEYGGTKGIGLIAEDVGKIIPEVVEYEEDGIYAKSLDYDHLVALVIEAIKEQQQEINQLKQEIQELKAIINKEE